MRECPARVRHVAAAGRTGLRRLWVSRALQPLSRTPKNRLRKNTVAAQPQSKIRVDSEPISDAHGVSDQAAVRSDYPLNSPPSPKRSLLLFDLYRRTRPFSMCAGRC